MKKSIMAFTLISTIFLCACSSAKYNPNGVGCYVSNGENTEVKTAVTKSCKTTRLEFVCPE